MNIAVLDEWLPYPADNGKKLRSLNLIAPLTREHRITYVCPCSRDSRHDHEAAGAARDLGLDVLWVKRPVPKNSGPLFAPRLAANLALTVPYSVQRHTSKPMRAALAELNAHRKIDLWHVEWTPYMRNLPDGVASPVVVDAHNIESLIWQRHWEEETNPAKAWYIQQQWKKFERFERKAFAAANCVVTTTQQDADLARIGFGANHVEVVDNGVDLSRFSYVTAGRTPANLLFLGSLNWRPNLDAVTLLLDRIFPAIQQQLPNARLTIVGLDPPGWLAAKVVGRSDVTLHGSVPDVRPYLKQCGALLVPLRVGGGSRIKIIEALASGCPVISTSIGAEGLHIAPVQHYVRADQEQDFVAATVNAVKGHRQLEAMTLAGNRLVKELYGWDALSQKLAEVWNSQIAKQEAILVS